MRNKIFVGDNIQKIIENCVKKLYIDFKYFELKKKHIFKFQFSINFLKSACDPEYLF